jgi:branched-chain amino acid transport system substrate-binding protein
VEQAGSTEPDAITEALSTLEVSTVVGDVAWGVDDTVPPYVAKTPLVGGQWRLDEGEDEGKNPYELVVVSNKLAPEIPTGGEVEPLQ